MNCEAVGRWLDEGQPEAFAAAARDHVAVCPRCAAALRGAAEIDALLAAPAARAPAAFTDRVMARLAAAEAHAAAPRPTVPDRSRRAAAAWARFAASASQPLAWWIDAAAQPATALAFAVASLALWQREALWRFATDLATRRWTVPALPLREVVYTSEVMTGVALALLPLAALAAWALYHAALRFMGPPHWQRMAR